MNARRTARLLILVLMVPWSSAQLASANDDIEQRLRSDYLDKVITLRHFYKGDHLSFKSDGSLVDPADVGPWTLDGQISVKSVELTNGVLVIRGRRVWLVFDAKAKPYRDALDWLAESDVHASGKGAASFRKQEVTIEIDLGMEKPGLDDISGATDAVFLKSEESIGEVVPDFWRDYFAQIDGRSPKGVRTVEPVYRVSPGEVSAPRQIFAPEPEFSEAARQAKYPGSVTLSLVVDDQGAVKDIQIVSPSGLGLDEQAVNAVSKWTFEPAIKNARPVPVELMVQMDFSLY